MPSDIPRYIGNYHLGESLGSGYSGSIFKARQVHTGEVVALKVQNVNHECPTNRYERGFYPSLQGGVGMPTLWGSGVEGQWDWLAIDLLGPSLDNLYRRSGKDTMDLSSVCTIAVQLIARLEFMHSRGILHRDIQLGNCVIGLPPYDHIIYMIDFGFSKRYIDQHTNRHIPDSRAKRDFIGNYWFSSVGVHCRGRVPSRRDDLEAAALMLIHLLTPRGLPWTRNGVPKTDEAHERLKKEKKAARPEDLCAGLPEEFEEFLFYCRRLHFQECPDYDNWKERFRELAQTEGFPESDDFIWPPVVQPKPFSKATARRSMAPDPQDVERILHDLVKMNMDDATRAGSSQSMEVIDITSDSEHEIQTIPPPHLTPKAHKLNKITRKLANAVDNATLSGLVLEFITILQSNSSRTLTREASSFLDALYKQLADPSVFEARAPLRTSRQSSNKSSQTEKEPAHVKLGVVARLKREVGSAPNNKTLAAMIQDFGQVTNNSAGRTISKDGFAFLEGLAGRLKDLK